MPGDINDGFRERVRRLLWQVVADATGDVSMSIRAGEPFDV